ncbi:hypothetical protein TcasGA2_TC031551 [Tribolium castaneum]|uniref:Uncharacterized protein n=1 Tax=Tribolium castaneum TaxID=7070 RepID=A0A139WPK7_TRICA|nr:hypothetical protein TcasGA2_TC031551 [Tribolium castaneum]
MATNKEPSVSKSDTSSTSSEEARVFQPPKICMPVPALLAKAEMSSVLR